MAFTKWCFTLTRRFLPKLNLTRNQNISPAKISLKTLEIPPTPTYAPYWTCKKHVSICKTCNIYHNAGHFELNWLRKDYWKRNLRIKELLNYCINLVTLILSNFSTSTFSSNIYLMKTIFISNLLVSHWVLHASNVGSFSPLMGQYPWRELHIAAPHYYKTAHPCKEIQ